MFTEQLSECIHVHDFRHLHQSAHKTGYSTDTALLSIKKKFMHPSLSRLCSEMVLFLPN